MIFAVPAGSGRPAGALSRRQNSPAATKPSGASSSANWPLGQRQGGAALLQAVGALRRAEEQRQNQAGDAGTQRRQVPDQRLAARCSGPGPAAAPAGHAIAPHGPLPRATAGRNRPGAGCRSGPGRWGTARRGAAARRTGIRPHGAPPHNWSADRRDAAECRARTAGGSRELNAAGEHLRTLGVVLAPIMALLAERARWPSTGAAAPGPGDGNC